MSLEVGGRASKTGDTYERLWAVKHALRVVLGKAQSLLWEPVGDEGKGVDLWLRENDQRRIGYQLKRQHRNSDRWSVATLDQEDILSNSRYQLERDSAASFVFVSSLPVPHLKDFAEQAHRANSNPQIFFHDIVCASAEAKKAFGDLLCRWTLDPNSQSDISRAYDLLRRMDFIVQDKSSQARRDVEFTAGLIFEGNTKAIVAALGDFLDNNLGNELHADQLRKAVVDGGFAFRRLAGAPGLPAAIEAINQSFDNAIASFLIAATPIERPEVSLLFEQLNSDRPPRIVFIHGQAGSGKSVIAYELIQKLSETSEPCLAIQLHSYRPEGTPDTYGRTKLGLPASPALSLRGLAGNRRAFLVLDQLDAVRFTSIHSYETWRSCAAIIDETLADKQTTLLVACRSFDLENDPQISSWKKTLCNQSKDSVYEQLVSDLPEQPVVELLSRYGATYTSFTTRQQRLLRTPIVLSIWWNLAKEGQVRTTFDNAAQLVRELLRRFRREIVSVHQQLEHNVKAVLSKIIKHMDREGCLHIPDSLTEDSTSTVDALCAVGLLRRNANRVTFVHQVFFDYLIAESVVNETLENGIEPFDWLLRNQALFRRDQLRQLLNLFRDADPSKHEDFLRAILFSDASRFHLKHLVLAHLGQAEPPLDYEVRIVVELAEHSEFWPHVCENVLWSKLHWFDALRERGYFGQWLDTWTDDESIRLLLNLFRPIAEHRWTEIDEILRPIWNRGKGWDQRIAMIFGFDPSDDSPAMFEFRLGKIRIADFQFNDLCISRLARSRPNRILPYIEAAIDQWILLIHRYLRGKGDKVRPRWPLRDDCLDEHVIAALHNNARRAWTVFSRYLTLLERFQQFSHRNFNNFEDMRNRDRQLDFSLNDAIEFLEESATTAAEGIAQTGFEVAREMLSLPTTCHSQTLQRVIAKGLIKSRPDAADAIINWICDDTSRFELGHGHRVSSHQPACDLIKEFSPHCSDTVFQRLELTVLGYHTAWERKSFEYQQERLRGNRLDRNDWGHAQNLLLYAMPVSRLSERALSVRAAWLTKFGDPAQEEASMQFVGGVMVSPIPPARLPQVSNQEWLRIIAQHWPERGLRWRQHGPELVGEASLGQFVEALHEAACREPPRFVQLALQLPRQSNPAYFSALLRAFTNQLQSDQNQSSALSQENLESVVEHFGECNEPNYVMALCRLIESRKDSRWSDALVDRIIKYADHAEPMEDTYTVHSGLGEVSTPDVGLTSINCVRGCVASAVTFLLWTRADAYDRLLPAAQKLFNDPHPAVRQEALGACLPILNRNKDLAVQLAVAACRHSDDRVLGSRWLHRIIQHARNTHSAQLVSIIERMIVAADDEIKEAGATWATAFWFDGHCDRQLVDQCCSGSKPQRIGVFRTAAQYFSAGSISADLTPIFEAMFHDPEPEVRREASGLFRYNNYFDLANADNVALLFVNSPAFLDDAGNLFHPLTDYEGDLSRYSQLLFSAVDRMVAGLAEETRDIRQRNAFAANEASILLLRLYDQAYSRRESSLVDQCLDRWDNMLRFRVGMTAEHLKSIDSA